MSESLIRGYMPGDSAAHLQQIKIFSEVGSTSSWLLEQTQSIGKARLCVTEAQTAGRGRRGNVWESAPGENIMMSLSWQFADWPEGLTGLSLATGMLIADKLNQDHDLAVRVKWPNDLLHENSKLAGILIDVAGQADSACTVVIGLGLNVHQPDWSRSGADYAWQDLRTLGIILDRNRFVAELTSELIGLLQGFASNGFAPLVDEWPRLSSYQGHTIRVDTEPQPVTGVMQGVDKFGALLVAGEDGQLHRFEDSSVSVRLVNSAGGSR